MPRPNSRCANVGCGLPIIEEEVLALHGPGRAPREIAVLTRLAGGRDCRRQPPPWRHHYHPAFLVIRDATIKETIGALYKRAWVSRSLHDTDLVNRPARSKTTGTSMAVNFNISSQLHRSSRGSVFLIAPRSSQAAAHHKSG